MSHRSRAPRVRQHVHCDSCYSRRCRARVEVSVCCSVIPCRLHCGAIFHLCKEEDHMLLCPNVKVPCINAGYGCPLHLPRSMRASHLRECPASVVCCSMEWLRWLNDDTNPHSDTALLESVMKDHKGQEEALDVAMALVDQSDLYSRLKMKPLYPELVEASEEEINEEQQEERAVGEKLVNGAANSDDHEATMETSLLNVVEAAQNHVGQQLNLNNESYNMAERMFSMEKGGCTAAGAQASHDKPKTNPKSSDKVKTTTQDNAGEEEAEAAAKTHQPPADTSKTGHAPWQEGVMERLREDLTPQEYNMYVVHHGRMLVSFGQIEACTPREKDFVYGSLEPIPVQTLRSFKVPVSYHYKQRLHLYDTAVRAQSESRSVDTSDLSVTEEDWFSDEAAATLLGYAEKEVMGHKISESKGIDGLYVDVGTQTHSFRSAPFKGRTTLADVMVDQPLKLCLQLQAERVNSRHNRASCVFSFLCGHSFLRREFSTHFRNVHSEIQTSLSGWFEQRCPLAYRGCTYSQRRFQPSTHKATISYNQQLKTFSLRPTLEGSFCDDSQLQGSSDVSRPAAQTGTGAEAGGGEDALSLLPYEVLCHVASFLDSLSLSQLALVSRLMRQVCSSLLQQRGMVTLRWERKTYSHGGVSWRGRHVWEFSHLFSTVDSWHMADISQISAHLKVCPYYEKYPSNKPVPLPSMRELQEGNEERLNLVKQFERKGWKQ
ncbi:F-box only protein 40-like [Takifugu rubripes]|uniref:F-box protein 40 n=1 Tax=Takifugu rubripes TaxID=31033 RepID=H2TYR6_TAKRU|nr:F-box only protein 40-like [Takifugu rubripes]